jgi:hypothetical protein
MKMSNRIFSVKIKEDFYNKSEEEIKELLNYVTKLYNDNLFNFDVQTSEYYSELIKILSKIYLEKLEKQMIASDQEPFKIVEINSKSVLALIGQESVKQELAEKTKSGHLKSNWYLLYDSIVKGEKPKQEFLDTFSRVALVNCCSRLQLKNVHNLTREQLSFKLKNIDVYITK